MNPSTTSLGRRACACLLSAALAASCVALPACGSASGSTDAGSSQQAAQQASDATRTVTVDGTDYTIPAEVTKVAPTIGALNQITMMLTTAAGEPSKVAATSTAQVSDQFKAILPSYQEGNPNGCDSSDVEQMIDAGVQVAVMVGAMLAVSGAAYQGIFRNPMVSPDILGVSSAASVGVAVGLLWGWPTLAIHALSFCCGIGAVVLVLLISRAARGRGGSATTVMILSGVVVGSIGSALLSLVKFVADPDNVLPAITYWLMGSFARSGTADSLAFVLAVLVVGTTTLLVLRWKLNAMTFGDEEARSLGVDVRRTRLLVIAAATLMTPATVCMCGVIGWVGLIIPHVVRLACGPNYRALLPLSVLTGGCFMLVVDDAARLLVASELPVGVLTALVGAPLFLVMLFRGQGADM